MGIQFSLNEIIDGKNRTGNGLIVHDDGSTDVNVVSCDVTLDVNVTNSPLDVSLVASENEPTVSNPARVQDPSDGREEPLRRTGEKCRQRNREIRDGSADLRDRSEEREQGEEGLAGRD